MNQANVIGPGIICKQLAFTIKGHQLLTPFDLQLEPNQWHGIVGPNGGGKSTLLKAIAGLLNHSGQIELHWAQSKGDIGYMPQLSPFDATLPVTALDFLRLHTNKRPVWRRYKQDCDIEAIVEHVNIQSLLHKRIGTLSTGERQRILLACALMHRPKLLLLDEPMAGMDKAGRKTMIELLNAFIAQGGTIVMIEHDWQIIEDCCDSVSVIEGTLKAHGQTQAVLEKFNTPIMRLNRAS